MTREFDISDTVYERAVRAETNRHIQGAESQKNASPLDSSDRGASCLARLTYGEGWCLLSDSHEGMCIGKVNAEPIVVEERKTWGWGR